MKLVWFLIFFVSCAKCSKILPSFVEQCYQGNDKELSDCVSRNINLLKPRMENGIPELLVPALNPLVIPSAVISNEKNFRCELKNIKLYHINNMTITKLNINFKERTWELEIDYSSLEVVTDYHMVGKLLVLEFNSMGQGNLNLTGINIKNNVILDTKLQEGKEVVFIKSSNLKVTVNSIILKFDNLFGQNEELNQRANQIMNENYKVFLDEFLPVIETVINNFIKNVLQSLYKKYPEDVLFPKK